MPKTPRECRRPKCGSAVLTGAGASVPEPGVFAIGLVSDISEPLNLLRAAAKDPDTYKRILKSWLSSLDAAPPDGVLTLPRYKYDQGRIPGRLSSTWILAAELFPANGYGQLSVVGALHPSTEAYTPTLYPVMPGQPSRLKSFA